MTQSTDDVAGVFAPFMPGEAYDCLRLDLADLGAEEVHRQLGQATQVLQGYLQAHMDINQPLYVALGAADTLIKEAREVIDKEETWREAAHRSDNFNNAYTIIEDASDDQIGLHNRTHILAVLGEARDNASREASKIKDSFGLSTSK